MKTETNTEHAALDLDSIVRDVESSGCFGRSKRQFQLFKHLLRKSFEGEASTVTQYSIALDVLNRPESFDANTDSIVRVEMHRLRANLEVYNSGGFEYSITVPPADFQVLVKPKKQSLAGQFSKNMAPIAVASILATLTFFAGYAIAGFNVNQEADLKTSVCSNVLPNLILRHEGKTSDTQLYLEKVLRSTIAQQTGFNLISQGDQCESIDHAPIFNVNYTVVSQGEKLNIALNVASNNDKSIISSHHISGNVSETNVNTNLYYDVVRVANEITMPDSITARVAIKDNWRIDRNKDAYGCILSMYDSFSGGTQDDFETVHTCLKSSLENENVPLDNYGALISSYLDIARGDDSARSTDSFKMAQSLLNQNKHLWINSAELTIAKLYFEAQRPDFNAERFDLLLFNAEMRYNTNPQVLLTVASFYGYTMGKWERAKLLSDRVKRILSSEDHSVFEIDAGYALMNLEGETLMKECSSLYSESSLYINIIVNACSRKAKDLLWFDRTEKKLNELNASEIEKRLSKFEVVRHDFQFLNTINEILRIDPRI